MITETENILETWRKYYEKLYANDEMLVTGGQKEYEREPCILMEEVKWAVKKLANNRSAGVDQITAEVLRATGSIGMRILHDICQAVWSTTEWRRMNIYAANERRWRVYFQK